MCQNFLALRPSQGDHQLPKFVITHVHVDASLCYGGQVGILTFLSRLPGVTIDAEALAELPQALSATSAGKLPTVWPVASPLSAMT